MKALLVALALVGSAGACEEADSRVEKPFEAQVQMSVLLPPLRYQGDGSHVVGYSNPYVVHEFCRGGDALPLGTVIYGCAFPRDKFVALPNPCLPQFQGESFARLACHEKGHILGWGSDHGL